MFKLKPMKIQRKISIAGILLIVFLLSYFLIQRSFVGLRYKQKILSLPISVISEEYKINLDVFGENVQVLKITDKSLIFKNPESIKIDRIEFQKYFFSLEIIESKKPNTFWNSFGNVLYEDSFVVNGVVVDLKFKSTSVPDDTKINPTISFNFSIGKLNYFGYMNAESDNEYYDYYRNGDKISDTQIEIVESMISSLIISNEKTHIESPEWIIVFTNTRMHLDLDS